ncbi:MAG: FGGY-family carbohydrate kinase [Actinomycetota bacterium]
MALLGLDMGSTSIKGIVFDEAGEIKAEASIPFKTVWHENTAEADAEEMWSAAVEVIKSVAGKASGIEAICVASHGETFIPVDGDCKPVYSAIMNSDNRAVNESQFWEKSIGRRNMYAITGMPLHPMFGINKIMWLKNNMPDVFASAKMFLSPADYILGRLGARPLTDYSLACRSMAFNINNFDWSDDILKEAGISKNMLPQCAPSGTSAGKVKSDMADILGLGSGVKAVVGGHDQPLSALGSGAINEGDVSDSAGTYECLAMISDTPKNNDAAYEYNLNSYCHAVDKKYITLAFFPAGFATSWFVDEFCGEDRILAEKEGIPLYQYLSQKIEKEPTGICVTPHFIGSCNPYWDMRAKGAIYGLAPDSSRHKLFKAIYEGLALELSLNVEALANVGTKFDCIRISGGNGRWPFSVQLRSDITGKIFYTMDTTQTVCKGAAMLAGIASGVYHDYEDAVKKTVHTDKKFEPDKDISESYERQKAIYRTLYPSLEKVRGI